MSHTFTIHPAIIKACLMIASKQNVRNYLTGVNLTATHATASNGYIGVTIRHKANISADSLALFTNNNLTLPRQMLEIALQCFDTKAFKDPKSTIGISFADNETFTISPQPHGRATSALFTDYFIKGKYPDIQQFYTETEPQAIPLQSLCISAKYLMLAERVAKLLGGKEYVTVFATSADSKAPKYIEFYDTKWQVDMAFMATSTNTGESISSRYHANTLREQNPADHDNSVLNVKSFS